MRYQRTAAIAGILLATSATAQPAGPIGKLRPFSFSTMSAAIVATTCADAPDRMEVKLDPCTAYILGAADGAAVAREFCLSGDSYTLQIVAVARRYLRDHPEKWNTNGYFVVRDALKQAFPCR